MINSPNSNPNKLGQEQYVTTLMSHINGCHSRYVVIELGLKFTSSPTETITKAESNIGYRDYKSVYTY